VRNVTEQERTQKTNRKFATRYIFITRFEGETNGESESNDRGSMKNSPLGFIPMTELEETARNR
jgi:hypothetical protein